jgi:Leucine-rich repeat (LRR) protein
MLPQSTKADFPALHRKHSLVLWFTGIAIIAVAILTLPLILPHIGVGTYRSIGDALRSPSSVTHLALVSQRLTEVPAEVRQLTNLRYLFLAGNSIKELPQWLPENSKIVEIGLSGNRFTTFPRELLQMTNLEDLHLGGNSIAELPDDIGRLASLRGLDLRNNDLTTIPEGISKLLQLRLIHLEGNRLPASVNEQLRKLLPNTEIDFGKQRN